MSRKTYSGFAFLFMMLFLVASPARVLAQVGTDITSLTTQTISTPATTVYNVTGGQQLRRQHLLIRSVDIMSSKSSAMCIHHDL